MHPRTLGSLLVVISAIVFSTAGIFTNGVAATSWSIIFWRGLAAALFTVSYLGLRGTLRTEVRAFGRPALAITLMYAAGSAAFIPAFKLSSVANVALIYGAAPFVAATLAWLALREAPARRVLWASGVAFAGVVVIFSGSAGTQASLGDLLSLFMTVMLAGSMVVYRAFPQTTAALPAALSSVVLLPIAFVLGDPLDVPFSELSVLILFGLVFAVASVTLSEGARRLPSSEVALLSILEMPLAPVLAYVLLEEHVAPSTLVGGTVIFVAVAWSQTKRVKAA